VIEAKGRALAAVSTEGVRGFFAHCGYHAPVPQLRTGSSGATSRWWTRSKEHENQVRNVRDVDQPPEVFTVSLVPTLTFASSR
jgi:hypothetical protein